MMMEVLNLRKYLILGPQEVRGCPPGDTVILDADDPHTAELLAANVIQLLDEPPSV
jgi:hypothetical protein